MNTPTSFGQWLKRRRRAFDLTQAELAQRAGCSEVTIRKMEADELRPSKQMAQRLAHELAIAPEEQVAFVRFARDLGGDEPQALPSAPWEPTAPSPASDPQPHLPAPPPRHDQHNFPVPASARSAPALRPPTEGLSQYEAVHLFIARALEVKPDFVVTNETAPAVAEICYRLNGLPLAIELAAAWIKLVSPEALLHRLQVSADGPRDLSTSQQMLHNAIRRNYDLLGPDEQILFRRVAVFVGGGTLEAIEAVCDAERDVASPILDVVASLVSKSLLRRTEGGEGDGARFVMLDTIQEYALERLAESGEGEGLARRHAEFFLQLAEAAQPQLGNGLPNFWLQRLGQEQDNLRAALRWAAETGETALSLRLVAALDWFGELAVLYSEGRGWLEGALARDATPDDYLSGGPQSG